MRLMSTVLKILGLAVIAVAGYWTYYSSFAPNPNDRVGVALIRWMPGPVRDWGCGKLNERFPGAAPGDCAASASTAI